MTRNLKEFVNHGVCEAKIDTVYREMGEDHVCILLALYNGAKTLGTQLDSIAAQSHRDWSLIVSDDGSSDMWFDIVAQFGDRHAPGKTWVMRGPGRGFARNFLHLLSLAGPLVPFVAFSDQDDAWMKHKLARALAHLKSVPANVPALYCGRTVICDGELRPLRESPCFRRPPSFANALVQNIGGGNTMVLNRAALDLVQDTLPAADDVVSHDWWIYQLITGAGGTVYYDRKPSVLYRQHGDNVIGANDTLLASSRRLGQLLAGRFRDWNRVNAAALDKVCHWLTPEARVTLDQFKKARSGRLFQRLAALRRSGIRRQSRRGNVALWLAALTDRL